MGKDRPTSDILRIGIEYFYMFVSAFPLVAYTTAVSDIGATRTASTRNPLLARRGYLAHVVSHFQSAETLLLEAFFEGDG